MTAGGEYVTERGRLGETLSFTGGPGEGRDARRECRAYGDTARGGCATTPRPALPGVPGGIHRLCHMFAVALIVLGLGFGLFLDRLYHHIAFLGGHVPGDAPFDILAGETHFLEA